MTMSGRTRWRQAVGHIAGFPDPVGTAARQQFEMTLKTSTSTTPIQKAGT